MSSDNGIYILETNAAPNGTLNGDKEYRVGHFTAIENLYYDISAPNPNRDHWNKPYDSPERMIYDEQYSAKFYSHDPDVMIKNARYMWNVSQVFNSKSEALLKAAEIEEKFSREEWPLEYGISVIRIDRVF